ncbi:MAG: hypothetical protein R3C13_08175 [Hyphomonas sp.]|uniref:hypothetical protein n=1 Tax=Hyphomonas sp. TaxID=87 RepID=UPI00352961C7
MRQAGTVLKLVSDQTDGPQPERAAVECNRVSSAQTRDNRRPVLSEWMDSHTRILGLWLDRLIEEGDDADLISMIHRQYAWLSMMQARLDRG